MKVNINKTGLFFCSDPHYSHPNIVRGTSTFEDKSRLRDFDTVEEHNEALLRGINSRVKENDILFCLGDWSFRGKGMVEEFRNKIVCKNIHLILGNHDDHIRSNEDLQKLFSSVSDYKEIQVSWENPDDPNGKYLRQDIVMCHYAMRVWRGSHKGSYMLHGHSHGTLEEMSIITSNPTWIGDQYFIKNYRTMDVGFDCHPEFSPFSFEEVRNKMAGRDVILSVDKH